MPGVIRPVLFSIVIFLFLAASVQAMSRKPAEPPYAPDEVLVKFHEHVGSERAAEIVHEEGGNVQRVLGPTGVYLVALPEGTDVLQAVKRFSEHPEVHYAEPNYRANRLEGK